MFVGVLCWILYLCYGTDFVTNQHRTEFLQFLGGATPNASNVKDFIAKSIFLKYITDACEVVLYLLATMTIVEILTSNGCFDFLSKWLLTRNSKKLLWSLAGATFLISANLDNLTTACMMLGIMHTLVANPRQRMVYGTVIVLAANTGGAFTVIGDATSLVLWIKGAITPTLYSGRLIIPMLVALSLPVYLLGKMLPDRLALVETAFRYRDAGENATERVKKLFMLIVGIGGLWFIPTFHRITHLSPFVGALCVLSLIWILNELYTRKLMNADRMVPRLFPQSLEYANLQTILFLIGVFLAIGAVQETGALKVVEAAFRSYIHNVYILGFVMGLISSFLDGTVVVISNLSTFPVSGDAQSAFSQDGLFWPFLSFCTAMGSSLFIIGSLAGNALMKIEKVSIGWYIRFISGKVLLGWMAGAVAFYVIAEYL